VDAIHSIEPKDDVKRNQKYEDILDDSQKK
jgi:hypothetical protein